MTCPRGGIVAHTSFSIIHFTLPRHSVLVRKTHKYTRTRPIEGQRTIARCLLLPSSFRVLQKLRPSLPRLSVSRAELSYCAVMCRRLSVDIFTKTLLMSTVVFLLSSLTDLARPAPLGRLCSRSPTFGSSVSCRVMDLVSLPGCLSTILSLFPSRTQPAWHRPCLHGRVQLCRMYCTTWGH